MRIVKLTVENIKKLKVVEITPNGNVVEVTGPNGSGKSSVLDAIFYALGRQDGVPNQVIRQGENKAVIKLDLGELVVIRHFAPSGTRLTVEAADGARYPSPQALLDGLVGALSFDPLEFIRMKPTQQLEALRSVIGLDLSKYDTEIEHCRNARLDVSRSVKQLEARLAAAAVPPADTPDAEVDVSELSAQLQHAAESNQVIALEADRRKQLAFEIQADLREADQKKNNIIETNVEAQRRIDAIIAQRDRTVDQLRKEELELRRRAEETDLKLKGLPLLPWPVDLNGYQGEIKAATITNNQVRLKLHRLGLEAELLTAREKLAQVNTRLEQVINVKTEAITGARLPLEGLAFDSQEVTYNGLPLVNASSAEQLRVSTAIAMAANPRLRVLRIKDGSLLDENGLKVLAEMAAAGDYQVWVERVEDAHGRPCVVMEDGTARTPGEDERAQLAGAETNPRCSQ